MESFREVFEERRNLNEGLIDWFKKSIKRVKAFVQGIWSNLGFGQEKRVILSELIQTDSINEASVGQFDLKSRMGNMAEYYCAYPCCPCRASILHAVRPGT